MTFDLVPDGSADLWMIQAFIQAFRLDAVTLALEQIAGFSGMTVSDCRGFGREKLRGASGEAEEADNFTPKVRLEIAIAGVDRAAAVAEAIARTAHTGRRGDGKVFVWPVVQAIRVRTFETGNAAL